MSLKNVIVLGASPNNTRVSYRAVKRLYNYDYNVTAIGNKSGTIASVEIVKNKPLIHDVYAVVLYLKPERQKEYYQYIIDIKPEMVFFNPGTYNPELVKILRENNIKIVEDCALAALSMGSF